MQLCCSCWYIDRSQSIYIKLIELKQSQVKWTLVKSSELKSFQVKWIQVKWSELKINQVNKSSQMNF